MYASITVLVASGRLLCFTTFSNASRDEPEPCQPANDRPGPRRRISKPPTCHLTSLRRLHHESSPSAPGCRSERRSAPLNLWSWSAAALRDICTVHDTRRGVAFWLFASIASRAWALVRCAWRCRSLAASSAHILTASALWGSPPLENCKACLSRLASKPHRHVRHLANTLASVS
jgi:hypothetical protein